MCSTRYSSIVGEILFTNVYTTNMILFMESNTFGHLIGHCTFSIPFVTGNFSAVEGLGSTFPNILQEANIDVFTIEECEELHGANDIENNEHVCVGVTGEAGSCNVRLPAKFTNTQSN